MLKLSRKRWFYMYKTDKFKYGLPIVYWLVVDNFGDLIRVSKVTCSGSLTTSSFH